MANNVMLPPSSSEFKTQMMRGVNNEVKRSGTELTATQQSNVVEILNEVYTKLVDDNEDFSSIRFSQNNFPAQVKRFARLGLSLHDNDFYVDIRNNRNTGGKDIALWIQYQGQEKILMKYCSKGGGITKILTDVVLEGEEFEYETDFRTGEDIITKHKKIDRLSAKIEKANVRGAYAIAYHKDGTATVAITSKERIDTAYNASPSKGNGPWGKHYGAMVLKTASHVLYNKLRNHIEMPDDLKADYTDVETDKAATEAEANENAHRETFEADYNVKEEPPKFDEKTGEVIQESKNAKEPEQEIQEEVYEAPF